MTPPIEEMPREAESAETVRTQNQMNLTEFAEIMRFFCCSKLIGIPLSYQHRKSDLFICQECYDTKIAETEQINCQQLIVPHVASESPHLLYCCVCRKQLFVVRNRAQDCETCFRKLLRRFNQRNVRNVPEVDSDADTDIIENND